MQLLTVSEVSARLRLSRAAVYRLIANGSLRAVKIGRSRRVAEQDLYDFIQDLRSRSVSPAEGGQDAAEPL